MKLAIIGGTSLKKLLDTKDRQTVDTAYGPATVTHGEFAGHDIYFLERHGDQHTMPPHMINHRANIAALADLGTTHIIAASAVGSLRKSKKPGDFVIPDDFIDWTRRVTTYYDDETVHVEMNEPYCPTLHRLLFETAKKENTGNETHEHGTYVCTDGPRFETGAEIHMLSKFGDVVGMTSVPEAILAKEKELCYAALCLVTNYGTSIGAPTSMKDVMALSKDKNEVIKRILSTVIPQIPEKRTCSCENALCDARA